jgi:Uma2 family endonuclease
MHASERPRRPFTVEEVLRMVDAGVLRENEPVELIHGELVVVSPQGPPHSTATTLARDFLSRAYGDGYVVREAKPLIAGASELPEPHLAVVRGSVRDFAVRHPSGSDAVLLLEVAKTSLQIDRGKVDVYARAGVPHYWILDLTSRRLELYTDPDPGGHYRVVRVLSELDSAQLPEVRVSLQVGELLP